MKNRLGLLAFVIVLFSIPLHALDLPATFRLEGEHAVTVTTFTEPEGSLLLVFDFDQLDENVFLRVTNPGTVQAEVRIWTDGALEALACVLRELGETINVAIVDSYLAKQACDATSAIALGLTAYSCLSIPAPVATLGCINGITKLVSCSLVACDGQHISF